MAFQIIRDDITKVTADAIVNTANPKPTFAAGTDAAIYKSAGVDDLFSYSTSGCTNLRWTCGQRIE